MQKLVKESIKTRNLIKRHRKKYAIPGLYEQCQKIRQILNKDSKLKNEFTIKDISDFFISYHMFSKSIFKMNENELAESLKGYFYRESELRYYYFRMDLDYRVVSNSRIGNGRIVHFSSLPQKVKQKLEAGYSHEQNRDYFANQTPENYKELRADDHYMKIEIKSKGRDNSIQKAIDSFYFNKSIFEFFTLSYFNEESGTSAVYISTNKNNDICTQTFGQANENRTYRKTFVTEFITKINQILDKEECTRNDIEKKILLAINIAGTHDSNPNVNVRFLFCIFAMDMLLIEDPNRGITHRLVERITFLLADDEDWLNYYNINILEKLKNRRKITKKYITRHLKNSRIELSSTMYKLYTKRSNIAHNSELNITEQDYNLAKLLLLKLVMKMLILLNQGIECIDNTQNYSENKSLKYVINQLKFG